MEEPPRQVVRVGDTDLGVREAGDGPSLLILHGALESARWLPGIARLAEQYRVVLLELPGFGASPIPGWLGTIDDLSFYLLTVLDEWFPGERMPVLGSCVGGWLAAEAAAWAPDRFERLVLVAPLGLYDPERPLRDVFRISGRLLYQQAVADPADAQRLFPGYDEPAAMLQIYHDRAGLSRLG